MHAHCTYRMAGAIIVINLLLGHSCCISGSVISSVFAVMLNHSELGSNVVECCARGGSCIRGIKCTSWAVVEQ
jgi:hypothetical protein